MTAIDSIQDRNHRARTFLKKFSQIKKRIIPRALMPFSKKIAPCNAPHEIVSVNWELAGRETVLQALVLVPVTWL